MSDREAIRQIEEILDGIDRDEILGDGGWWETSTGAEFGAERLAQVRAVLDAAESEAASLRATVAGLREQLDEAQLRSIEARNPGIDMEQVKRERAAAAPEGVQPL